MAVVLKDRVCRNCGAVFIGGPRAWYCPNCRAIRKKESWVKYTQKGRIADRPLGSVDECVRCGKEYIVRHARQKYCPDCANEATREVDRKQSIEWNQAHKEEYYKERNEKRRKNRYCIICGNLITAKTATVTCDDPDCKRERIRQRQRAADAKRRGKEPPSDYTPTKETSYTRKSETSME